MNCAKCGSEKVIPNAGIWDPLGGGPVDVQWLGKPDAMIFKDPSHAVLIVQVCGACGHAELRVPPEQAQAMFAKYQDSRP